MKKLSVSIVVVLFLISAISCSDTSEQPKNDATKAPSTTLAATVAPTASAVPSATASPATPSVKPTASAEANPTKEPIAIASAEPILNKTGVPLNTFTLDVTLNAKSHKLVVKQTIDYNNNTSKKLKDIYFNLIPDAYKKDGGSVKMTSFAIGDKKCKLRQVKETVYKVNLPSTLAAGDKLKLDMKYEVNIPNIRNRFGYQKKVFNLGNFIVTPAVYEKDGWTVEPYVDLGDAFYTDIANYDVTIHVPKGYTVAASGKDNGNGTYHIENVRDFAFCASDSYETLEEEYDGVTLTVYYGDKIKKTAERVMDVAKNSLKLYNATFGKYPYETLSLVMNGLTGGVSGMEYPTLVMLAPEILVENLKDFKVDMSNKVEVQTYLRGIDNTTCHEIAHQWFYGIVGNDEISEPWLDEGFCRFSEYLYEKAYLPFFTKDSGYQLEFRLEQEHVYIKGVQTSKDYEDTTYFGESLYYWMENDPMGYWEIYDKGAALLYQMQKTMGEEAFQAAVKEYVNKFAYRFVTTDEFKKFWGSKGDFEDLFHLYFNKRK